MKTLPILGLVGVLCCCLSCTADAQHKQQTTAKETPVLMGSTRDEHGCIPTAGYTWSEIKQECVRVWEVGQTIYYKKTTGRTYQGIFVIFSADSSRMESYEMGQKQWERVENSPSWLSTDHQQRLTLTDSIYHLNDSTSFPIWILEEL